LPPEVQAYEDHCLRVLREGGFRITMPRVQVIRALADTDRALSAYAVHEKILEVGGKIDVVSVYRILATLQEVGLIHHIGGRLLPLPFAQGARERLADRGL
jgi:Fe2+ or Zn2+ uptake regulation protein